MGRRALRPIDPALDLSRYFFTFEELPRPWAPANFFPVEIGPSEDAELPTDETAVLSAADKARLAARPLEIDVGCGKGMSVAGAAASNPGVNFIGIEVRHKYARYTASRLAKLRLTNAVAIKADAERLFAEEIPTASVDGVHVLFPDPWWKARHKKRRIINASFLAQLERVLKPGGTFHFWTDVEEYFYVGVETVQESTRLTGPFEVPEKPPEHDLDFRTNFERRKRQAGLPIYRALFRKPE